MPKGNPGAYFEGYREGGMVGPAPGMGGGAAMPPGAQAPPQGGGMDPRTLQEDFLANAIEAVYEPQTAETIREMLLDKPNQNPVENLGEVVAMVVSQVEQSAPGPVPREILVQAAAALSEDIGMELAPAAGLKKFSKEKVKGAFYKAMELLAEAQQGAQGGPGPPTAPIMPEPPIPGAQGMAGPAMPQEQPAGLPGMGGGPPM